MCNYVKANEYYMTNADSIYDLMRKTLIYVTKINKTTFNYKIADWRANNDLAKERLEVFIHYNANYIGKLEHSECFSHLNKQNILDLVIK